MVKYFEKFYWIEEFQTNYDLKSVKLKFYLITNIKPVLHMRIYKWPKI